MIEKLKGLRTYLTLVVVAILGLLVQTQQMCLTTVNVQIDASDPNLEALCRHINKPWLGAAITILSFIAAWFRKQATASPVKQ